MDTMIDNRTKLQIFAIHFHIGTVIKGESLILKIKKLENVRRNLEFPR